MELLFLESQSVCCVSDAVAGLDELTQSPAVKSH